MDFLRCPRKHGKPDLRHKLESPDIGSIVARERPPTVTYWKNSGLRRPQAGTK